VGLAPHDWQPGAYVPSTELRLLFLGLDHFMRPLTRSSHTIIRLRLHQTRVVRAHPGRDRVHCLTNFHREILRGLAATIGTSRK